MAIRLVVGLGNPGERYADTRHNIGFRVVEALARQNGWGFKDESRFMGSLAKGGRKDNKNNCFVLMPATYMNESGCAVRKVVDYYKIDAEEVLVVADDVAIGFTEMRLKEKGSAGGHNGLKSIEVHLGTSKYPRLRMGVGDKKRGVLTDHVLGRFSREEEEILATFVEKGKEIVARLLEGEPIERVMGDANRRERAKKKEEEPEAGPETGPETGIGDVNDPGKDAPL